MSNITVIGCGYVGLVSAACFSRLGHQVVCVERDADRLASLRANSLPLREPGLEDLWIRGRELGSLSVTGDYSSALADAEFVFLAVGTPARASGASDLTQILDATRSIAAGMNAERLPIVVLKSTVPMGTAERVSYLLAEMLPATPRTVSNPEFLREGCAVFDFMRPDRIVIGCDEQEDGESVAALYQTLGRPVIFCNPRTAEAIKYAANSFLCTKISFINEIASICEAIDVDVNDVREAIGMDPRIGHKYLDPGIGWGGSCLPKDIASLIWNASRAGVDTPLLRVVEEVNNLQPELIVLKLKSLVGSLKGLTIAVWGLAFKPDCDDVRDSPALSVIRLLRDEEATVRAFDPLAMPAASAVIPEIFMCEDAYEAADGADAALLTTHWRSFEGLDWNDLRERMARPVIVDGRNALDPAAMIEAGFAYAGIGRPSAVDEHLEEGDDSTKVSGTRPARSRDQSQSRSLS